MERELEDDRGHFPKPAKLLQKEKKQVAQLLDEKFPPAETTGETPDKSVSQISHLKYIPPLKRAFTAKERNVRRKVGLINKGYEMHVSAYYQGLTFDKKRKRVEPHVGPWRFRRTISYPGKKIWKGRDSK
jgi:hypothetical protein